MGQKVNPNALRYGINKNWLSRWAEKDEKQAAKWIIEDEKIRNYFLKTFKTAQVVQTEIERTQKTISVYLTAGQPGLILGKEGANVKNITLAINKIVGKRIKVAFSVIPYEMPTWSARVVAREIADAIENRVSFRVAQKMAIKKVMMSKAKGIKTNVSGRLGGVEMAREEGYVEGMMPTSTLRANIDYALEEALTTYGIIGVKVWINRGEIFKNSNRQRREDRKDDNRERRPRDNRDFNKDGKRPERSFRPQTKPANVLRLPREEKPAVSSEVKIENKEVK